MKIYAVADLHGAQYRVNEAYEIIKEHSPDVTCVCGDITQFGPGDIATVLLDQLPGPVLVVTGNIDTTDVVEGIKQSHADDIHKRRVEIKGVSFLGLNGVSDQETRRFFQNQDNASLFHQLDVLVSHVPPFGYQDTVFLGRHAGSKILSEIVETKRPRLVLCGHIHENPGFIKTDHTMIVNCSMGKRGRGALITLDSHITVTMFD
jgi:uncharacterized protein